MDLYSVLESLGLENLTELFRHEDITLSVLAEMTHEDLKSVGVKTFGQRHKILNYFKENMNLKTGDNFNGQEVEVEVGFQNMVDIPHRTLLNSSEKCTVMDENGNFVCSASLTIEDDAQNDANVDHVYPNLADFPRSNTVCYSTEVFTSPSSSFDPNASKDLFEDVDDYVAQNNSEIWLPEKNSTTKEERLDYGIDKKECEICRKKVKVLSKHLKLHNLDREERLQICYAARKRKVLDSRTRRCPFSECLNLPGHPRLDHHFLHKHKLSKTDDIYVKFIRKYKGTENKQPHKISKVASSAFCIGECSKFFEYLQTLGGGCLSKANAKQQMGRLRQMLEGTEISLVENISSPASIRRFEKWMTDYVSVHQPSSGITYCSTLITYLKYLRDFCDGNFVGISKFINNIYIWEKAFRKSAKAKENAHEEISIEEAQIFLTSDLYKDFKIELKTFKEGNRNITKQQHARFRNILIVLALFRNGSRSGALAHMTLKEFESPEIHNDQVSKECYVVSVEKHKTVGLHGAAKIVLPKDFYESYSIYKDYVRPLLAIDFGNNSLASSLFITWSGKNINSDDLGKGIQGAWKAAGLKSKLNTTMFRKTTTTRVHATMEHEKEGVARHLCHTLTTAENRYKIVSRAQQSVHTSNVIFGVLTGNLEMEDSTENVDMANSTESPITNLVSLDSEDDTSLSTSELTVNPYTSACAVKKPRGRCYYDCNERRVIKEVFEEFIGLCVVPKLKTIQEVIDNEPRLNSLMDNKKCDPLKIKGAIQNFVNIEKNRKKHLTRHA